MGLPDAFVPVYKGSYNKTPADIAPSKVPANPMISLVMVGGFLLIAFGLGSTLFGSFQSKQDTKVLIDQAVQEALAKQQTEVANCVNQVFDGKAPTKSKKRKQT